jgi:hypothetical protein
MVNYSLNFIRLLLTNEARTVDVKHSAEVAYTSEMQRALKNTVWQSGCSSWYVTGNRLLAEMHLPKVERLEYRVHKQGHCEDEGAEGGQDARARACNRWSVEV